MGSRFYSYLFKNREFVNCKIKLDKSFVQQKCVVFLGIFLILFINFDLIFQYLIQQNVLFILILHNSCLFVLSNTQRFVVYSKYHDEQYTFYTKVIILQSTPESWLSRLQRQNKPQHCGRPDKWWPKETVWFVWGPLNLTIKPRVCVWAREPTAKKHSPSVCDGALGLTWQLNPGPFILLSKC